MVKTINNNLEDRKLTVRLIKKNNANISSIFKIEKETFGNDSDNLSLNSWSLMTFLRYGKIFGVFDADSLRGFVIYVKSWNDPTFIYLAKIAIEGDSQGFGYGSLLLTKSLTALKKQGIINVGLTVDPKNERNMYLYQDKFGFKISEFRKDEYGSGYDRFFMKLNLTNWSRNKIRK